MLRLRFYNIIMSFLFIIITTTCKPEDPQITRLIGKVGSKGVEISAQTVWLDNDAKKSADSDPNNEVDKAPEVAEKYRTPSRIDYVSNIKKLDIQKTPMPDGNTYDNIKIPGTTFNADPGEPLLPSYGQSIPVPADTKAKVIVDSSKTKEMDGEYTVLPVQYPKIDSNEGVIELPFVKNDDTYNQKDCLNQNPVSILEKMTVKGQRYVQVVYSPISVCPSTGKMIVTTEVEWHVSFTNPDGEEYQPESEAFNLISSEDNESETDPLKDVGAKYLILVHDELFQSAKSLAQWKYQKGLKTAIVKTSEIDNDGNQNGASAQEIRSYLLNAYQKWGVRPEYIMLIGDLNKIPGSSIVGHQYLDEEFPTDLYYSTLDGSDYQPDVMIGRFVCSNEMECNNLVTKSLKYQLDPDLSSEYWQNVLIAAEFEGNADGVEERVFVETAEVHSTYWANKGYNVNRVYQSNTSSTNYYHNVNSIMHENGSIYNPKPQFIGSDDQAVSTIMDQINKGTFLMLHRGHGTLSGWITPQFTFNEVDALTNEDKLPVIFSLNCSTGTMDGDFSKSLMGHTTGGSHALIGAVHLSGSGYNDWLAHGLVNSLEGDFFTSVGALKDCKNKAFTDNNWKGSKIGQMLNYAKRIVYDNFSSGKGTKLTYELFHLQGDPEMDVRTSLPLEIEADHPAEIVLNDPDMEVIVRQEGVSLEGATVALTLLLEEDENNNYQSDDEYRYFLTKTGSEGRVSLEYLPFLVGETLTLTIYEQNSIPYITTIPITDSQDPTDGPPYIVTHPKDKIVDRGDSFTLSVEVLGTKPFTYQWKFNGEDLPGATQDTFTIETTNSTDSGSYTVVVSNFFETITSNKASIFVQNNQPISVNSSYIAWQSEAGTAALNNVPTGTTNQTQLDIDVLLDNNIISYRYKTINGSDCGTDDTGYSDEIDVSININEDIYGLQDGFVTVCVVGKDNTGSWQSFSSPTSPAPWIKNTVGDIDLSTTTHIGANHEGGIVTFAKGPDRPQSIILDGDSNIYVTGRTKSDFGGLDCTDPSKCLISSTGTLRKWDNFVNKFNNSGTLQSAYQSGLNSDLSNKALDDVSYNIEIKGNDLYIVGGTKGNIVDGEYSKNGDVFFIKMNKDSGTMSCAAQLGTSLGEVSIGGSDVERAECADYGRSIAVNDNNDIFIAGYTRGHLGEVNTSNQNKCSKNKKDVFVAKFDSNCNQLWIKQLGGTPELGENGTLDETVTDMILSNNQDAMYVTGYTKSNLMESNAGGNTENAFIAKFSTTDGSLVWLSQLGSTTSAGISGVVNAADTSSNGIDLDSAGNIYITGKTKSNLAETNTGNNDDVFIAKIIDNGNSASWQWIKQIGSETTNKDDTTLTGNDIVLDTAAKEVATAIRVDVSDNIIITGYTNGNFAAINNQNSSGNNTDDIFIARFDPTGNILTINQYGTSSDDQSSALTIDTNGKCYITGQTKGELAGETNPNNYYYDLFISIFDNCSTKLKETLCDNNTLIDNAEWNEETAADEKSIFQQYVVEFNTVTADTWKPTTNGVYNTEASDFECRYKCQGAFVWDSVNSACVVPTVEFVVDNNFSVREDDNPGTVEVTVTLNAAITGDITVPFSTSGTATINNDYTLSESQFSIPAGSTTSTITFSVTNEELYEDTTAETVIIELTGTPTGASLGNNTQFNIAINDNDNVPIAYIIASDENPMEGDTIDVSVSLSNPSIYQVTGSYSIDAASTAVTPDDHNLTATGNIMVAAEQLIGSQSVQTVDNTVFDGASSDTIIVSLDSANNAIVNVPESVTISINDNEGPPSVVFSNSLMSVNEDAGTIQVSVSLTAQVAKDITVDYRVLTGNTDDANPNADYTLAATGSFAVNSMDWTGSIDIDILEDTIFEGNIAEKIRLELTSSVDATITNPSTMTVEITDNNTPFVSFATPLQIVPEGNQATITFELNIDSSADITVNYSVDAIQTDANLDDYDAAALTGTIIIPANSSTVDLVLDIGPDDNIFEGRQSIALEIDNSTPGEVDVSANNHTIRINDDDDAPEINFVDLTQNFNEPDGTTNIGVTLSNPIDGVTVSFEYLTDPNSTANSADDYSFLTNNPIAITAPDTSATITLSIANDIIFEADETVSISLDAGSLDNGVLGSTTSTHTVTIINDDPIPEIDFTVDSQTVNEGAVSSATVSLSMSSASVLDTTVVLTLGGTATDIDDYTFNSYSITIDGGVTTTSVSIDIIDNNANEGNIPETIIFGFDPGGLIYAAVGSINPNHTINISDILDYPKIRFAATSQAPVNEGDNAVVVAQLTKDTSVDVSFDFEISGTATGGGVDYHYPISGTRTFIAPQISMSITIAIEDDALYEGNENFSITLSNPQEATIDDPNSTHFVIISDNADKPTIDFATAAQTSFEGTSTNVVVSLSKAIANDLWVSFAYRAEATSTATNDDYTFITNSSVTITAPDSTTPITLSINDDNIYELIETIDISFVNGSIQNADLGTTNTTHTITINSDDPFPSIDFVNPDQIASEGDNTSIALTLSHPSAEDVTAVFILSGTAIGGDDYSFNMTPFNIGAMNTSVNISVNILDDIIYEGTTPETIIFAFDESNFVNLNAGTTQDNHTVSINDDPDYPEIGFTTTSQNINEGESATFNIELSRQTTVDVSFDYNIGGSAIGGGDDYTYASTGNLTFTAGQTAMSITISTIDNTAFEGDETISVTLSNPDLANIDLANSLHTITINDDNDKPEIYFTLPSLSKDEGDFVTEISVTLSKPSDIDIIVNYILGGDAEPDDHTFSAGAITISFPDTTAMISGTLNTDTAYEGTEVLSFNLDSPINANLGSPSSFSLSIIDPAIPLINFISAGITVAEDVGSIDVSVTLSNQAIVPVAIGFTVGGTALKSQNDHNLSPSSFSIAFPNSTDTITVPITDDLVYEGNETILISLNAGSAQNTGVGAQADYTITINDNGDFPKVTFDPPSQTIPEGNPATVTVTMDKASTLTVSVPYTISGTATGGGDDHNFANGTFSFAAYDTQESVSGNTIDNNIFENNETIIFTMGTPTNAEKGSNTTATIIIDDIADHPVLEFVNSSIEIAEEIGTTAVPMLLTRVANNPVTVDYTVTGIAVAPQDHDLLASGQFIIPATQTNFSLTIAIQDNDSYEGFESFTISLDNADNASISSVKKTYTVNIDDSNDIPQAYFISAGQTANEGELPKVNAIISKPISIPVEIDYSITGTAEASDHGFTAGTITIDAGLTNFQMSELIANNDIFEDDETIIFTMTSTDQGILGTQDTHTILIDDDEDKPRISFTTASQTVAEDSELASIAITLTSQSDFAITVDYTVDGTNSTASNPDDHTFETTRFYLSPYQASYQVSRTIVNDNTFESPETAVLYLTNPVGAVLEDPQTHTITITDVGDVPEVSFISSGQTYNEGDSPSIQVTISNPVDIEVIAEYTVTDISTELDDHQFVNASFTFSALNSTATLTKLINNNSTFEDTESFSLSLTDTDTIDIGDISTYTVTISDEEDLPSIYFAIASQNKTEGNPATVIVVLSGGTELNTSVQYSVSGSATSTDHTFVNGTFNIASPGNMAQIDKVIQQDTKYEGNENIVFTLSNPVNAQLGGQTTHTINIDDESDRPSVSFSASAQEVNENSGFAAVSVSLTNPTYLPVAVNYAVDVSSTSSGTEHGFSTETFTITPPSLSASIIKAINDDNAYESDETIVLTLNSPSNADLIDPQTHTITVKDDGDIPIINFTAASQTINEGLSAYITVEMPIAADIDIEVGYQVTGGSAESADHEYTTGSLIITSGNTDASTNKLILNNDIYEGEETIIISLIDSPDIDIGTTGTHTITIDDSADKPAVYFATDSQTKFEGNSATIRVNLSKVTEIPVTVDYTTTGSATVAQDHTFPESGSFTLNPPNNTITLDKTISTDPAYEGFETVVFTLSNVSGATSGTQDVHTITIDDEDDKPTVYFSSTSQTVDENSGFAAISVAVSNATYQTVTVNYSVTGGTATVSDHEFTSGTFSIAPLNLEATILKTIKNDDAYENDETLEITLNTPSNATLVNPKVHNITIKDDGDVPLVSFIDTEQAIDEGLPATIDVTISSPSAVPTVVEYILTGGDVEANDHDFANGNVTIAAGSYSTSFVGSILQNNVYEGEETLTISLVDTPTVNLGTKNTHTITINDSDDKPALKFATASQIKSETTATENATITIVLTKRSDLTLNADFVVGGSSNSSDHGFISRAITLNPGFTLFEETKTIKNDNTYEGEETIYFTLQNANTADLGVMDNHIIYITDDQDIPTIAFTSDSQSVSEATGVATVSVEVSNPTLIPVSVTYVVDASSTATAGDHSFATSTIEVSSPETTGYKISNITDDAIFEFDETIVLKLQSANIASIVNPNTHTITITDNGDRPSVFFSSPSQSVAEGGNPTVTAKLSETVEITLVVDYTIGGGDAEETDHGFTSGSFTFNSTNTASVQRTLIQDDVYENSETVVFNLMSGANYSVSNPTSHVLSILNEEDKPTVRIVDSSQTLNEGDNALVMVQLSNAAETTVTVDYTVGGTAESSDHPFISNSTITFDPLATTKTVVGSIIDDTIYEGNETVILTLLNPSNTDIHETLYRQTITIQDNGDWPEIAFATANQTVDEGDFTEVVVSLSNSAELTITANYTIDTVDSSADSNDHSFVTSGSFTVYPNNLTSSMGDILTNDDIYEGSTPETLIFNLSNPGNATLGEPNAHVIYIDDVDDIPIVELVGTASNALEGETVTLTLNMTRKVQSDVIIPVIIFGGSAERDADYTFSYSSITIPQNSLSKDFSFNILTDSYTEFDETIIIDFLQPDYGILGGNNRYTVTILGETSCTITDNTNWPPGNLSDCSTLQIAAGGTLNTDSDSTVTVDNLIIYGELVNNGSLVVNTEVQLYAGIYTQTKTGSFTSGATTDLKFKSGTSSWSIYNHAGLTIPTFRNININVDAFASQITNNSYSNYGEGESHGLIMKATNNLTIPSGSGIDVTSKGFSPNGPNSNGQYSYGSVTEPDLPGTRGNNSSCGPGGGAIHIIVLNTLTLDGFIKANGGVCGSSPWGNHSGVSGGAVWIETSYLIGDGYIESKATAHEVNASGGRVAIYASNSLATDWSRDIDAWGRNSPSTNDGSIYEVYSNKMYFENDSVELKANFDLVTISDYTTVNVPTDVTRNIGQITMTGSSTVNIPAGTSNADDTKLLVNTLTNTGGDVNNYGYLKINTAFNLNDGNYFQYGEWSNLEAETTAAVLDITGNSTWSIARTAYDNSRLAQFKNIYVRAGATVSTIENATFEANPWHEYYSLMLKAKDMTIETSGSVDVTGTGYYRSGPGYGCPVTHDYSSATHPEDYGSQGTNSNCARGGGATHIIIQNTLTVNGSIKANGSPSCGSSPWGNHSASSGGSIWIETNNLYGNGDLQSKSGIHECNDQGGRIAIYSINSNPSDFDGEYYMNGKNTDDNPGSFYWSGYTLTHDHDFNLFQYGSESATSQSGSASSTDTALEIALDSSGNIIVAGSTSSSLKSTANGGYDMFVAKYNSSGSLQWIQNWGTSNNDEIHDLSINGTDIFIVGYTNGELVTGETAGSYNDIYFAKLSGTDGTITWEKQWGRTSTACSSADYTEAATGIDLDTSGNPIIIGKCDGNGFFAKINPSTGATTWLKYWRSGTYSIPYDIKLDSSNNIYLTGSTEGNIYITNRGGDDILMEKYNSSGTSATCGIQEGTGNNDQGDRLTLDSSNNIYLAATTRGYLFEENQSPGNQDVITVKYNSSCTEQWVKQWGLDSWYQLNVSLSGNEYPYDIEWISTHKLLLTVSTTRLYNIHPATGRIIEQVHRHNSNMNNTKNRGIIYSSSTDTCYLSGSTTSSWGESAAGNGDISILQIPNCD